MAASEIKAGRAYVEVTAKDDSMMRVLAGVQRKMAAFAAIVNAMGDKVRSIGRAFTELGGSIVASGARLFGWGVAAVAAFGVAAKAYAGAGDALAKMSARTGVGVEALSGLTYAAKQSGTDAETLEGALRKMGGTIVGAKRGSAEAALALRQLGLSVRDVENLSPEDQFLLIGDRLSRIQNPTVRAAAAMAVFGKSGAALLPMFADGAKGVEELIAHMQRLGLLISTQDAVAAEEFGDRVGDMWEVLMNGAFRIGSAVTPAMRELVVGVTSVAVAANQWISAHRDVVVTAMKVAAGVTAAGAAFLGLGYAAKIVGGAFQGVGMVVSAAGTALSAVAGAAGLIVTPIGLISAGLMTAAGAFIYFSNTGNMAVDALKGAFAKVVESIGFVIGTTGDLSSAWGAAMDEMKFTARQLWEDVKVIWSQAKAFAGQVFDEMGDLFVKAWIYAVSEGAKVIARGVAAYQKLTNSIGDRLAKGELKIQIRAAQGEVDRLTDRKNRGVAHQDEIDYLPKAQKKVDDLKFQLQQAEKGVHPEDKIIDDNKRAILDEIDRQRAQDLRIVDQSRGDHAGTRQDAVDAARADADQNKAAIEEERVNARINRALDLFEAGGRSYRDKLDSIFGSSSVVTARRKMPKPDDLSELMGRTARAGAGTFNAFAADSLGGNTIQERIAKATEDTAKGVKKIAGAGALAYGP